jgi:hypothetical protein
MKACGGVVVQIHVLLTSALVGGEWSASHKATHWIVCWMGPKTGLDVVEMRQFLTLPGLKLRFLGRAARNHADYAFLAPSVHRDI